MPKSVNVFSSSRNVLFQILKCTCPVICFNAKDFVRTVLQYLGDDGSWKHGKLRLIGGEDGSLGTRDWRLNGNSLVGLSPESAGSAPTPQCPG